MGDSLSESQTTEDAVTPPEEHGVKSKKQSPPGLSPAAAHRKSDGRKQEATACQRKIDMNATKASKRSSSSKASLSKASSKPDLIASKSPKAYNAHRGSSAATPNRTASLFPTNDASPEGGPNQGKPAKFGKYPSRGKSGVQSRESPKDCTPGNVSVKPTKESQMRAENAGDGAGKRRGPSTGPSPAEGSRVSRATSKRASPAKKDDKGSPATADKRSLLSKASRTVKRSPSSSSKRRIDNWGKHGGQRVDLEGEPDVSRAPVISIGRSSSGSARSSKRSPRALEEGSVEEKEGHRKYGKKNSLVMPDGQPLDVAEKNRLIRAMQKERLGCHYKKWCCKFAIGMTMILIVYIIVFRPDFMRELAQIIRDFIHTPENYRGTENEGENYTTSTGSSTQKGTFSLHRAPAARLSGCNHLKRAAKQDHGAPH